MPQNDISSASQDAYVCTELRAMARRAYRLSAIASTEEDRQRLSRLTGALEARAMAFEGQPLPDPGNQLAQLWRWVLG
jgi:hypothetical protein